MNQLLASPEDTLAQLDRLLMVDGHVTDWSDPSAPLTGHGADGAGMMPHRPVGAGTDGMAEIWLG